MMYGNMKMLKRLLCFIMLFFIPVVVMSATPLITFTPLTATNIQLYPSNTAVVQYNLQNQSSKTHTFIMKPIAGITQSTGGGNCANAFILSSKQSCVLSLTVNGSQLQNSVQGGPVVCQQGSDGQPDSLQCYQPGQNDILNITLLTPFTIIPSTDGHGTISPNTTQTVVSGASLLFTATADPTYAVSQWLVDGAAAQIGGSTFLLANIVANHTVEVIFTQSLIFYTGTQNGNVYYSTNNGAAWAITHSPGSGSVIHSVFVTSSTLYASAQNGLVYYSTNNGLTWNATTPPDGSSVNSIFVTSSALYAATDNGSVYYSTDNGNTWNSTTQPDGSAVDSIFVSVNGLYAGTANGNVCYSANNGISWIVINGQPDGSSVNAIFVRGNTIFVGTANEFVYSSTFLTGGGTWSTVAQSVYSLFVNSTGNTLYKGTQNGFVFSVTDSTELGFVTNSPLNSLFILNS